MRNAHKTLSEKLKERDNLGDRRRWENNIQMDLRETWYGALRPNLSGSEYGPLRSFVNTVVKFRTELFN